MGVAVSLSIGNDSGRKRTTGQAAQDHRGAGASDDQSDPSLASRPRHQTAGRYGLHRAGAGVYAQAKQVTLVTTGRLDAVLHESPPEHTAHPIGRLRVVSPRLPSLEQVSHNPETNWQSLTLDWYGEGKRQLEIRTGTALWYRSGFASLPIHWVLTRDPAGKHPRNPPSFPLTQPYQQKRSSRIFMKRWNLEVTFEESRTHLGIETQHQ